MSSKLKPWSGIMMKYCAISDLWLFMTPLGLPVVPLVYMMIQMSSGSTSVAGSSGLAAAMASSKETQPS